MPQPFLARFLALTGLLALLLVATGCQSRAEREAIFDNQLREMSGAPEAALLLSLIHI